MRHYKIAVFLQVSAAALLLTAVGPTSAQEAGADEEAIEEIIVTSRKLGAENLREIPAAISALDSEALEEMMVVDFEDFARHVPGLTFLDGSPGERRYVIRGIQSAGQQQVAVYYDEVPLPGVQSASSNSGSQTTDLKLYDMERVEVLRGPQGTVFGANSQGGTVRFITKQPVLGEFEGYASVELSRTEPSSSNNTNFQAVANLPLSDNFAARVLVYDGEDAGYIDNNRCRALNPAEDPRDPATTLSCFNLNDYNFIETTGLRTNFLWQVSDTTTIRAQYWWQDRFLGGDNRYHPFDGYNPNPTHPVYGGNRDNVADFTFFQEGKFRSGDYARTHKPDEQTIASLTGEFELPFANLTATLSQYNRDFEFKFDSTWIITFLFENIDPTFFQTRADLTFAVTDQHQRLKQNAFEFRFNSKDPDARIQWVAGGFWRDRASRFHSFVPVVDANGQQFSPPNPPTLPPTSAPGQGIPGCHPCVFARTDNKDIEETAIFGEVDWAINDYLNLNVGVRWFDVDQLEEGLQNFNFAAFAPNPPDPTTPTGATPSSFNNLDDSEVPWKVALAWHASDVTTVYGVRSNGFRLGGTNNRGIAVVIIPESFEADELTSYEFGVKTLFGERQTALNASVFLMEWENMQVDADDLTGAFGFIANAGKAEVQGIELDIASAITDNLHVTGQITYLSKKELTEDQLRTDADIADPGLRGDPLPRVPEYTAALTAQYNFNMPIPEWDGAVRLEGNYTDDSFTSWRPTASSNRIQDSYTIFNARANFRNHDWDLDLTLFIENVFDEDGDVFIGGGGGGQPTNKITNRPRTVGVQVTKGFGRD
ncbi:MAG: TonB-dependent receptor [Woeseiaceae bacterium]